MRFRPRLCNVLLWGILYGYTETAQAPLYIKKAYKDEPSFRDAKVVFSEVT